MGAVVDRCKRASQDYQTPQAKCAFSPYFCAGTLSQFFRRSFWRSGKTDPRRYPISRHVHCCRKGCSLDQKLLITYFISRSGNHLIFLSHNILFRILSIYRDLKCGFFIKHRHHSFMWTIYHMHSHLRTLTELAFCAHPYANDACRMERKVVAQILRPPVQHGCSQLEAKICCSGSALWEHVHGDGMILVTGHSMSALQWIEMAVWNILKRAGDHWYLRGKGSF